MRVIVVRGRTLILIAAAAVLGIGLVLLLLASDSLRVLQVTTPADGEREVPIYSVQTEEPRVALTFDATWGAEYTGRLLQVLEEHDAQATFFLTNIWMNDYPDHTQEIWAAGHEVGLHSANHPDLTTLSPEDIRGELEDNLAMVRSLCDDARPRLFRPPFGSYDDTVIRIARDEMDLVPIQWSVDSLDWREVTADYVYNRVTTLLHPGAIILFHNNARPTAEALPNIIRHLRDNDYEILPLSELLHPEPYEVDHRGQQIPRDDPPGE